MPSMIDDTLVGLGWKELIQLADFHDKQATVCRARAQTICDYEHNDSKIDQRVKRLWDLPKYVIQNLRKGHDLQTAQKLASDHTGTTLSAVQSHWKRFLREKSNENLRERNRLIVHLCSLGLTNTEIGKRVDLHPNSVSRILSRLKKHSKIAVERPENRNILFFRQEQAKNKQDTIKRRNSAFS